MKNTAFSTSQVHVNLQQFTFNTPPTIKGVTPTEVICNTAFTVEMATTNPKVNLVYTQLGTGAPVSFKDVIKKAKLHMGSPVTTIYVVVFARRINNKFVDDFKVYKVTQNKVTRIE